MSNLVKPNKCFEEGVKASELTSVVTRVSTLESKVTSLESNAGSGNTTTSAVTGVKGAGENSYRSGYVNLTPANIGALALSGGTVSGALNLSGATNITGIAKLNNNYTTTTNIYPAANGTYTCGTQANLWSRVYSNQYILPYGALYESSNCTVMSVFAEFTCRKVGDVDTLMPMTASSFTSPSSRRYKKNITEMTEEDANKILNISVKKFDYKKEENGVGVAGCIAEDVNEILPNVVTKKEINGQELPDGIDYSKLVPYLVKKVQMLSNKVEELENRG